MINCMFNIHKTKLLKQLYIQKRFFHRVFPLWNFETFEKRNATIAKEKSSCH